MKIYRFRVILPYEEEDIIRDLEIKPDNTLHDFHLAIQKAFGGKKVIDLSKAAKEVDAFITQARAAKTLEGNAAAKKLAQYKQLLERSAKLSLKGGLETKRALQRSAARYYDKEIVPAMKAAQKAVARNLRLQTEKAAP